MLSVFFTSLAFAQTPNILTYQGKLTHQGTDVSGERTITARLYGNAEGTEKVWEGTYKTYVTDGIFALPLGAGKYPLPAPTKLDKQLWVGITVDGIELRPLTQLTSSPYALNVADKSITKAKLADELVGTLGKQDPQNANSTNYWSVDGNYSIGDSSYLGTSGAEILTLKVNSVRVMEYIPNGTSANILGGHSSNTISLGGSLGSVISGGGYADHPNEIGPGGASSYSFIGGGFDNSLDGGASVIGGGEGNTMVASWTVIGGGYSNAIGGGTNGSDYSAILGGYSNSIAGQYSTILGGKTLALTGDNVLAFNGGTSISFGGSQAVYFNDVDIFLDNHDDNARRLIFFEPNGTGTQATTFKAQSQTASIDYILPNTIAGATGKALAIQSITGTEATLTWSDMDANAWKLTGNSGTLSVTNSGTNFLGTIDNKAFDIQVNSNRVMRYQPDATSPNIIGGSSNNSITGAVSGSVIAGGGSAGSPNNISSSFSTIAGGSGNEILSSYAFIGGGFINKIRTVNSNSSWGVITGGYNNELKVDAKGSVIGGGFTNFIDGKLNMIGGGEINKVNAADVYIDADTSYYITISGGKENFSQNLNIANFPGNVMPLSPPVNMPDYATIGGGELNCVHSDFATVGGGSFNHAEGVYSTIPGGWSLTAFDWQTVVGRWNRTWPMALTYAADDRLKNHFDIDASTPTASHNFVSDRNYPIFQIGNGGRTIQFNGSTETQKSNAFEVTDWGYTLVRGNLTDQGVTVTGTNSVPSEPAFFGATYQDNIIYAWGDVKPPVNTLIENQNLITLDKCKLHGVAEVMFVKNNQYRITINAKPSPTDELSRLNPLPTIDEGSVVATLVTENEETDTHCGSIKVTRISNNIFDVFTFDQVATAKTVKVRVGNPPSYTEEWQTVNTTSCQIIALPFTFIVTGRPTH